MNGRRLVLAGTAVSLLALTACGGSGSGGTTGPTSPIVTDQGNAGLNQNPNATAPAAPIPGAKRGGTLTVLSDAGFSSMDPTDAYYTNTVSILSGLVTRSLTQYVYDAKTKQMVLIPDIATNLGTPSNNFKTWKFTIRHGVKFENGRRSRHRTSRTASSGPSTGPRSPEAPTTATSTSSTARPTRGRTSDGTNYAGLSIKGWTITLQMAKPFPDMPYWGAFPAMGPIPSGRRQQPGHLQEPPALDRPVQVLVVHARDVAHAGQATPYWSANTDPGRHAYINEFDFNFVTDSAKIDQIMLGDSGQGQTTIYLRQRACGRLPDVPAAGSDPVDPRRVAVHVHLVPGQPQDHERPGASCARMGVPVQGGVGSPAATSRA